MRFLSLFVCIFLVLPVLANDNNKKILSKVMRINSAKLLKQQIWGSNLSKQDKKFFYTRFRSLGVKQLPRIQYNKNTQSFKFSILKKTIKLKVLVMGAGVFKINGKRFVSRPEWTNSERVLKYEHFLRSTLRKTSWLSYFLPEAYGVERDLDNTELAFKSSYWVREGALGLAWSDVYFFDTIQKKMRDLGKASKERGENRDKGYPYRANVTCGSNKNGADYRLVVEEGVSDAADSQHFKTTHTLHLASNGKALKGVVPHPYYKNYIVRRETTIHQSTGDHTLKKKHPGITLKEELQGNNVGKKMITRLSKNPRALYTARNLTVSEDLSDVGGKDITSGDKDSKYASALKDLFRVKQARMGFDKNVEPLLELLFNCCKNPKGCESEVNGDKLFGFQQYTPVYQDGPSQKSDQK